MIAPLVSIIIPAYNRAQLITETLDCVLAQHYSNWECIIVDDGSTDDTENVVSNYLNKDSRFKFYSRPEHKLKGPSSCRNYGFQKSNGLFLLFLDSDDLLSPLCLKNRIQFINQNPNFDLYIFRTDVFYDQNISQTKPFRALFQEYTDSDYLKLFLEGRAPFCVMSPLWPRQSFEKLGGFDESLRVLEDPDLHLRFFLNSMKAKTNYLGDADNFYRKTTTKKDTTINDFNIIAMGNYLYFKKHFVSKNKETRMFALRSFRADILLNSNPNISSTNKLFFLFLRNNVFNFIQVLLYPIALLYVFINLNNSKGLGYHKFVNLIIKNN